MRIVRIVIAAFFLANIPFYLYLSHVLIHARPQVATDDFRIPFEAHGGVTYVSSFDIAFFRGSMLLGVVLFILSVFLNFLQKEIGSKE